MLSGNVSDPGITRGNWLMSLPPMRDAPPAGIDRLDGECYIADTVSVMRYGAPNPERGIHLGVGVMLFDHVRLLLGNPDEHPQAYIRLGNRVIINVGCYVSGEGGLIIEDDVLIGAHTHILSAGHQIHGGDAVIARNPLSYAPVHIGTGAWLGAGSAVLQGVTIGSGAVVGAGSVVTRDVPAFAIVVGNPSRIKGFRKGHAANNGRFLTTLLRIGIERFFK